MSAVEFKGITGQERALKILKSQIISGKIPHAYLFTGQSGVGKRKTAVEFARALECMSGTKPCGECVPCRKISKGLHPDVHILDFEWQAEFLEEESEKQTQFKIDSVRELQREISLRPMEGRYRTFIIDPADKMNQESANSFLKTLEEPPENSILILISTLREGLPKTVISRCQNVSFRPLSNNEISDVLAGLRGGDSQSYSRIARFAGGSISLALDLIESFGEDAEAGSVFLESKIWMAVREGRLEPARIAEENAQLFSGRAGMEKLLNMMLMSAQTDMEESNAADTAKIALAAEKIMSYKKALRYNVNPKLISTVLVYELSGIFSEENRR